MVQTGSALGERDCLALRLRAIVDPLFDSRHWASAWSRAWVSHLSLRSTREPTLYILVTFGVGNATTRHRAVWDLNAQDAGYDVGSPGSVVLSNDDGSDEVETFARRSRRKVHYPTLSDKKCMGPEARILKTRPYVAARRTRCHACTSPDVLRDLRWLCQLGFYSFQIEFLFPQL